MTGLPDFIGIGAAKSGTSWLASCLSSHPDVFVPARKELNSFDYLDFGQACIERYKEHFSCPHTVSAKGEFSTIYLHSKRAPPRIKRIVPDVKLVVSLRNPVDQIYSHYWHLRRQNFHQGVLHNGSMSVERALSEFPSLLMEPALYHKHLTRWFRYFDDDQILVVFYDDIVASPASVLYSVFEFLGVDCTDEFISNVIQVDNVVRQGVSPRTPNLEKIHRLIYSVLVRRIYNPLKQITGPRRAAAVKDTLRLRQIMEYTFFNRGYPEMDSDVRFMLVEMLREEIKALAKLTGRDLSHWR